MVTADDLCVICGRPTADGYACHADALSLAQTLRDAAGHAEDAEAVLSRQARYGGGGRGGSDEPTPVDLVASARLGAIDTAVGGWVRLLTEETGRTPRWRTLAGPLCPPIGIRCAHDSCAAQPRADPTRSKPPGRRVSA